MLLHSPLPLNPLPPPQWVRVNAVLSRVLGYHYTEVTWCNQHFICSMLLCGPLALYKRLWDVLCIVSVVCDVVKFHFPHTTQVAPWYSWSTLLNMICVVVGVNILSFLIVKVCLFPHNTMGSSSAAEAHCVTATCWGQTMEGVV